MRSARKAPPPPPSDPLPEEVRYLTFFGVPYYIRWEELDVGCSFFLRTTASQDMVVAALAPAKSHLKMEFVCRPRCEFGMYGIRVWRIY
jgi:hypothetical protein